MLFHVHFERAGGAGTSIKAHFVPLTFFKMQIMLDELHLVILRADGRNVEFILAIFHIACCGGAAVSLQSPSDIGRIKATVENAIAVGRHLNRRRKRGAIQRIILDKVPNFNTRIDTDSLVHGIPVTLASNREQTDFDVILAAAPDFERSGRTRLARRIRLCNLGTRRAFLRRDPALEGIHGAVVIHHVIGSAVRMHNRHRALGRVHPAATRNRRYGRNHVAHLVCRMVAHHAAHRKSRNIHAIFVNAVLVVHFIDNRLEEIDVLVATDVPGLVLTVREHDHKSCGIGNRFPLGSVLLIRGILIHAVHLDNKRTTLFDILRSIHVHGTVRAVHINVVCKRKSCKAC